MGKILIPTTLVCDPETKNLIRGFAENAMPLLGQSDPQLMYSPYWPLLDNKEPAPGEPPVFACGDDADCYNTSAVTLLATALANRDPSMVPGAFSRTQIFNEVIATPPVSWNPPPNHIVLHGDIPKGVNQLAWWVQNLVTSKNAYYITECLADFGPLFQTSPNPRDYNNLPGTNLYTSNHGACFRDFFTLKTTHLTNEYIISLIENDFVVLVAGFWVIPQVDSNGNVAFEVCETHKMVVSGWQTGEYPLYINVVFAVNQQCASLTPISQSSRDFGSIALGSHATVKGRDIPAAALVAPVTVVCPSLGKFPMPSLISLDFIGEVEGKTDATHNQFIFINQIDAFSLNWRPPQRVFEGTWAPLTHLVLLGNGSLVGYDSQTGALSLSTLAVDGAITIREHQWTCYYTHLMPFVHNAVSYFLAYNSQTGAAAFCLIESQGPAPQVVWSGIWGTGFTTFMPFQIQGAPHFLAYNSNTGMAQIDCISSNLEGCYTRFQANWATGFTTFAPIVLEGSPGYITYDKTSGAVQFVTIGLQGEVGGGQPGNDLFLTWTANGTWAPGWSHIVSVPWAGLPHYFAYDSANGSAQFARISQDGSGATSLWSGSIPTGGQAFGAFTIAYQPYVLFYNLETHQASFYTATPL